MKTDLTKEPGSFQEVSVREDTTSVVVCPHCRARYKVNAENLEVDERGDTPHGNG